MASSIGDLIWQMSGKEDPRAALLAQAAGVGTPATPGAVDSTSGGAAAPGATAGGAASATTTTGPVPESLKSTPDMVELYTQLADKQNFEHSINNGLGLILSSMAYDENKSSIQSAFGVGGSGSSNDLTGGGAGDGLDFMSKMMKLRTDQAALTQQAAHRAALPSIAKQYGLDLETAQYLFDSGKLDAVIQEAEKPDQQIIQGNDGRSYIVDKSTGAVSAPLGPEKQREIELVTNANTGEQTAVYKDTKEPVAGRAPVVAGERKADTITDANTGKVIAVDAISKEPIPGREPLVKGVKKTKYIDLPDGGKRLVYADTELPVGLADIDSIGATDKAKLWHDAMRDREKRGLPEVPMEEWLTKHERSSAADANSVYGNPPTDMAWKRDDKGEIVVENGVPQPVPLPGTKRAEEAAAAKNAASGQSDMKSQTAGIVSEDIDRAIKLIDDNSKTLLPVTGPGALLAAIPGTDAGELAGMFDTIKANIGFDKLNAIRASNTTGGGLGPISDFENALLQATFGSLRQQGQEKNLKYNLRRVQKLYNAIVTTGIKNQAEADKILGSVPLDDDPEVEALIKKHTKKKD